MKNKFKVPTKQEIMERLKKIPDDLWKQCPYCHRKFYYRKFGRLAVCPNCQYGLRLKARQRIKQICDDFIEIDANVAMNLQQVDKQYQQKIVVAQKSTRINESILTGIAKIGSIRTAVGVMDTNFIMGSLGQKTGEKIVHLFQEATKQKLPVILFTASGGARMQDGIFSLMQMAKISAEVEKHSEAGLLYVTVLTDPTTGGVTASFAMQGDILIAEPHALIGFAGRRVIEQTLHQNPPADFQRAETLLKHGLLDDIVPRSVLKAYLTNLLMMYQEDL